MIIPIASLCFGVLLSFACNFRGFEPSPIDATTTIRKDGELDDTQGMLFIFENIKPQKFKMQNTLVSLDIIFLEKSGCVLNIAEFAEPMSDRIYASEGSIKYAVEVRAGFSKRFKIKKGTCIRWQRQ